MVWQLSGAQRLLDPRQQGRGGCGVRPLGIGKIHADQMRECAGAVSTRRSHHRWHFSGRARHRSAQVALARGYGVPTFRIVSASFDHGESDARADPRIEAKRRRGTCKRRHAARSRRPQGTGCEIPRPALRRTTTACRHRPRPGHGPHVHAVRRAHLRARPGDDQRSARCDGGTGP